MIHRLLLLQSSSCAAQEFLPHLELLLSSSSCACAQEFAILSFAAAANVIVYCSRISAPSLVVASVAVVCCLSSMSDSSDATAIVVIACFPSCVSDSSCAAASCSPVNLCSSSSYFCSTSWRFAHKLGTTRASNDAGYLVCLVSLQGLCFCFFVFQSSFFLVHRNRKCAVTDLWSLP